MWLNRSRPLDINLQSPNWAKKKLFLKIPNKRIKRLDLERSRKRVPLGFGLSNELWNEGKMDILLGKGNYL